LTGEEDALTLALSQREREQEQEVAEIAEEETAASEEEVDTELAEEALTPALSQRERERNATEGVPYSADRLDRQAAAARVRESTVLSPGIRERMAAVVEATGELARDGRTLVSLDEAMRALDEALPGAIRLGAGDVQRPEHPAGGAFFRTTPAGEMSDDEANDIARGQLARSGLLRGQRARVAQD
jgi:hypothetical protein